MSPPGQGFRPGRRLLRLPGRARQVVDAQARERGATSTASALPFAIIHGSNGVFGGAEKQGPLTRRAVRPVRHSWREWIVIATGLWLTAPPRAWRRVAPAGWRCRGRGRRRRRRAG